MCAQNPRRDRGRVAATSALEGEGGFRESKPTSPLRDSREAAENVTKGTEDFFELSPSAGRGRCGALRVFSEHGALWAASARPGHRPAEPGQLSCFSCPAASRPVPLPLLRLSGWRPKRLETGAGISPSPSAPLVLGPWCVLCSYQPTCKPASFQWGLLDVQMSCYLGFMTQKSHRPGVIQTDRNTLKFISALGQPGPPSVCM